MNKYQWKVSIKRRIQYLDYLIDPSFQDINRLLLLSLEDLTHQTRYTEYFLLEVEAKYDWLMSKIRIDYNQWTKLWLINNFMIDEQNVFDQPVKMI